MVNGTRMLAAPFSSPWGRVRLPPVRAQAGVWQRGEPTSLRAHYGPGTRVVSCSFRTCSPAMNPEDGKWSNTVIYRKMLWHNMLRILAWGVMESPLRPGTHLTLAKPSRRPKAPAAQCLVRRSWLSANPNLPTCSGPRPPNPPQTASTARPRFAHRTNPKKQSEGSYPTPWPETHSA